jgi:dolichol-phosphate mannosyltransferase
MKTHMCVVIPTYKEAENIAALLLALEEVAADLVTYGMDIVVADDRSPDGTAAVVRSMQSEYENIYLLSGDRKGMGAAYVRVFPALVDSYDVIITMDADFSHPPDMIPQFLKRIDEGCDVVIGSRYIGGGGAPDWPVQRRLISGGANLLARMVAGVSGIHDCTSNYRAIRTAVLREVTLDRVSNRGYAFVTSTLWEYKNQNAHICEIPLIFYDRKKGETKLKLQDIIEFFINCFRLRLRSVIGS